MNTPTHIPNSRCASGYSLIEILITVAATAILFAALVIPALNILRDTKLSGCRNNIEVIKAAKTSWCADHPADYQTIKEGTATSAVVAQEAIYIYFPMNDLPKCPDHGVYSNWNVIGADPTCSASGH